MPTPRGFPSSAPLSFDTLATTAPSLQMPAEGLCDAIASPCHKRAQRVVCPQLLSAPIVRAISPNTHSMMLLQNLMHFRTGYEDSTLIMQLLRDNLTFWTSDMQDARGSRTRSHANINTLGLGLVPYDASRGLRLVPCNAGGLGPIPYSANITPSIAVNAGGVAGTRPICNADTIPPLPCCKCQRARFVCQLPTPHLPRILFNSINGKAYAPVNRDRTAWGGGFGRVPYRGGQPRRVRATPGPRRARMCSVRRKRGGLRLVPYNASEGDLGTMPARGLHVL
jgi:hypothetical protein